jgi:hypothetical protein
MIHKGFNLIPDVSRSIDSSIFVMLHASLVATDVLNHIGAALYRCHLAG